MSVVRWAASAASAGEPVASARRESVRETTQVHDDRHGQHRDADAEALHAGALDQVAHGLEGDDHAADEDEHALDGRGHVLDLLVAVGVRLVGRHVGRAHREERDDRGDEVGGRVQGLGEQRDRARDGAGDRLEQDERRVRGDRERRGARLGRLAAHRLAGARLAQVAQQRAGRAAAVADGVLLGRRELGHRAAVVAVVGDEDRVVAEAARAARRVGHASRCSDPRRATPRRCADRRAR